VGPLGFENLNPSHPKSRLKVIFKEAEDPELIKILAFCKAEGFIKVQASVSDELFYA